MYIRRKNVQGNNKNDDAAFVIFGKIVLVTIDIRGSESCRGLR